jgi:mono/diheme cytochrome c family protein
MSKWIIGVIGIAVLSVSTALAQETPTPGSMASGGVLFEQNCAFCHGDDGAGQSPYFPALAGNDVLQDVTRIVTNIHQGQGNMPPFPDLTAEEIAALASYIRNSWQNSYGEVSVTEASAVIGGLDQGGVPGTIWDGVYSEAQIMRGRLAYDGNCGACHGRRLNGAPIDPDMQSSPPLARAKFLRNWNGRSLAILFDYTRSSMPQSNPGSLSDAQYVDIIAYMLSVSGAASGDAELLPDDAAMAWIRIVLEK